MKASCNHSIRASVSNVQPHSARWEASECAIPEVDNNAGHGWPPPMLAQNPLGTRSMLLVPKSCHETGLFRSVFPGKIAYFLVLASYWQWLESPIHMKLHTSTTLPPVLSHFAVDPSILGTSSPSLRIPSLR